LWWQGSLSKINLERNRQDRRSNPRSQAGRNSQRRSRADSSSLHNQADSSSNPQRSRPDRSSL
jgi:hypothetical protein